MKSRRTLYMECLGYDLKKVYISYATTHTKRAAQQICQISNKYGGRNVNLVVTNVGLFFRKFFLLFVYLI